MKSVSISDIFQKCLLFLLFTVLFVVHQGEISFASSSSWPEMDVRAIFYDDAQGQSAETIKRRLESTYAYKDDKHKNPGYYQKFITTGSGRNFSEAEKKPFTSLTPEQLNGITISSMQEVSEHDGNQDDDHDFDDTRTTYTNVYHYYSDPNYDEHYYYWKGHKKKISGQDGYYRYESWQSSDHRTWNVNAYESDALDETNVYINPSANFQENGGYYRRGHGSTIKDVPLYATAWNFKITKNGKAIPYRLVAYCSYKSSRSESWDYILFVSPHVHNSNGYYYVPNSGDLLHHTKYTYCDAHGSDHTQNLKKVTDYTGLDKKEYTHYDNNGDGICDADGCKTVMYREIVFDGNEGSVFPQYKATVPSKMTVRYNSTINPLPKSVRDHYDFLGWYTARSGGTKIEPATKIISDDYKITFYAHWQPHIYNIKYILHGCTYNDAPSNYNIETPTFSLKTPAVPKGMKLDHWECYQSEEKFTTDQHVGNVNGVMTVPKGTYGNLMFEAVIVPESNDLVKVTAKINHFRIDPYKNVKTAAFSVKSSVDGVISSSVPGTFNVYKDNTLISYSTRSYGEFVPEGILMKVDSIIPDEGYRYNGADTLTSTVSSEKDSDIILQFTKFQYSISYEVTGDDTTDSMDASKYPSSYTAVDSFTIPAAERRGYTFKEWNISGANAIGTGSDFSNGKISRGTTGNLLCKALWDVDTYKITYNLGGGAVAAPESYTVEDTIDLPEPSKKGYTFTGWTGSNGTIPEKNVHISDSVGDLSYTANWVRDTYTIEYDLDGGTADNPTSYNVESAAITLNNPVKTGYTFLGWSGDYLENDASDSENHDDSESGSDSDTSSDTATPVLSKKVVIASGTTGDLLFKANWEINQYTLTIDPASGTWDGKASIKQDYLSSVKVETVPTRNGYTFRGWSASGVGTWDDSAKTWTYGAGDGKLTAQWAFTADIKPCAVQYNGSSQDLVGSVAKPSDATVYYSTDNKTFSTAVPTGKDVGEYTFYFKVTAPNASPVTGQITSSIYKAPQGSMSIDDNKLTYNKSAQALGKVTPGVGGVSVTYSSDGKNYSSVVPTGTSAGSYTVYFKIAGDKNHTDKEGAYTKVINKAKSSIHFGTIPEGDNKIVVSYTYDGDSYDIKAATTTTDGSKLVSLTLDKSKKAVTVETKAHAVGDVDIKISASEGTNYLACSETRTLTIGSQSVSDSDEFKNALTGWGVAGLTKKTSPQNDENWYGATGTVSGGSDPNHVFDSEGKYTIVESVNTRYMTGFYFKNSDGTVPQYKDIVLDFEMTSPDGDDDGMGAMVRWNSNGNNKYSGYLMFLDNQSTGDIQHGKYNGIWRFNKADFSGTDDWGDDISRPAWTSGNGFTQLNHNAGITWARAKWQHYRFQAIGNRITVYRWDIRSDGKYDTSKVSPIFDYTDTSTNAVKSGTYGFWCWSIPYAQYRLLTVTTSDPDKIHIAEKK